MGKRVVYRALGLTIALLSLSLGTAFAQRAPEAGMRAGPAVWIEEYWENSLCGWEGPKYLTIGAVGALYAGSPPREVWRGQARAEEQGYYRGRDLIWITTTRLATGLLTSLPAGPGWPGKR